jgi:hypothetical protein
MLATALLTLALAATAAEPIPAVLPPSLAPSPVQVLRRRHSISRPARPGLAYLGGLGGAVIGTGAGLLVTAPITWAGGPPETMVLVPMGTLAGASLGVHLLSDSEYGWELLGAGVGMASTVPVFAVVLTGAMLPQPEGSTDLYGAIILGVPVAAYFGLTSLGAWVASRWAEGSRRSVQVAPQVLPGEDGRALLAVGLGASF